MKKTSIILAAILVLTLFLGACAKEPSVQESKTVEASVSDIAKAVIGTDSLKDMSIMNEAVQPGAEYFPGFGNYKITGYSEGRNFAPMISTIPFMGYIFRVEDPEKVEEFKTAIKENANMRWNICTEADTMICESVKDVVLFVMLPSENMPDAVEQLTAAFKEAAK